MASTSGTNSSNSVQERSKQTSNKSARSSQSSIQNLLGGLPKSSTSSWQKHHWGKHYWDGKSNRWVQACTAVRGGRVLVVCVLLFVASLLGFVAFTILTEDEQNLAETQFRSISQRALVEARTIIQSRRDAGVTMSKMLAELHPNASQWPFVPVWGFERLAESLLHTANGRDMGFVPYVQPSQATDFEVFARGVYEKLDANATQKRPEIWATNLSTTPPTVYHDTTGETPYSSPYQILTPIFRTDEGMNNTILLFNPHSQQLPGRAIDRLIACSKKRHQLQQEALNATGEPLHDDISCGVLTGFFPIIRFKRRWGAAHFYPIYPVNDPFTIVGHISSMFAVEELLQNAFATEVDGIDACFETYDQAVTFSIRHGAAYFVGEGKFHDPKYEHQQQTIELLDPTMYADAPLSIQFRLTPNDDFYKIYETNNPAYVTLGAVCTILVTSLVFFLYDFLVRREFHAKRELLEARRQFMRFVSHEVRTPLNAVSMGLDLMQAELAQALGYESATSLRASGALDEEDPSDRTDNGKNGGHDCNQVPTGQVKEALLRASSTEIPNASNHRHGSSSATCLSSQRALDWFQLTQEIQGNTQGAVDILNDILNYDKISQGNLQLGTEVISLWELLEIAILEFKLSASSKQVQLGISFGCENDADSDEMADKDVEALMQHQQVKISRALDLPEAIAGLKVIGDSVRLTQVLRNLMSNALKFTPPHGCVEVFATYEPSEKSLSIMDLSTRSTKAEEGQQRITLDKGDAVTAMPQGCIKVRVKDTGAGMSAEQLSKLFNDGVQFRANELQAGQGSGLGLFIAKGIVEQHKGILVATSDGIGHGTTFEMKLPLWQLVQTDGESRVLFINPENLEIPTAEDNSETGTRASAKDESTLLDSVKPDPPIDTTEEFKPAEETARPPCLYILVVDDVMSNRKLLKRLLERNGHQCEEAENGQVAVQMVAQAASRQTPFDSILLDFEMPIMDGPTAAKEIRRLGFDKLVIVGITGNVLPEDVIFFKGCGANDVLAKPVKIPELHASWMENGIRIHCSSKTT